MFVDGNPTNCAAFEPDIQDNDLLCLNFLNNACASGNFPSVIVAVVSLTFLNCVFQGNAFVHFLGGESCSMSPVLAMPPACRSPL
jgi:hypothetical protein